MIMHEFSQQAPRTRLGDRAVSGGVWPPRAFALGPVSGYTPSARPERGSRSRDCRKRYAISVAEPKISTSQFRVISVVLSELPPCAAGAAPAPRMGRSWAGGGDWGGGAVPGRGVRPRTGARGASSIER